MAKRNTEVRSIREDIRRLYAKSGLLGGECPVNDLLKYVNLDKRSVFEEIEVLTIGGEEVLSDVEGSLVEHREIAYKAMVLAGVCHARGANRAAFRASALFVCMNERLGCLRDDTDRLLHTRLSASIAFMILVPALVSILGEQKEDWERASEEAISALQSLCGGSPGRLRHFRHALLNARAIAARLATRFDSRLSVIDSQARALKAALELSFLQELSNSVPSCEEALKSSIACSVYTPTSPLGGLFGAANSSFNEGWEVSQSYKDIDTQCVDGIPRSTCEFALLMRELSQNIEGVLYEDLTKTNSIYVQGVAFSLRGLFLEEVYWRSRIGTFNGVSFIGGEEPDSPVYSCRPSL